MIDLKAMRLSRNLTQEELAKKLGTTQQAVARWEKGQGLPRKSKLEKLAALFGVPISSFYDVPGPEEVPAQPRALESIIKDEPLTYNGRPLADDDRERVRLALDALFYDKDKTAVGAPKGPYRTAAKEAKPVLPENAMILSKPEKNLVGKYRQLSPDHQVAAAAVVDTYYLMDNADAKEGQGGTTA